MVSVDKNKCIGCGACVSICEGVFEMKDGKSIVKKGQEKSKVPGKHSTMRPFMPESRSEAAVLFQEAGAATGMRSGQRYCGEYPRTGGA